MRHFTLFALLALTPATATGQGIAASIAIPLDGSFNVATWNPWAVRSLLHLVPEPARLAAPAVTLAVWQASGSAAHLALHDLRGKVVVLDFWNRACPPCTPLHEALVQAAPRWRTEGVEVLSVLSSESPNGLTAFFTSHGGPPPFPVLLDPDGEALHQFGSYGFPTVIVLDHYGRVAMDRLPGARRLSELEALFPTLVAATSRF